MNSVDLEALATDRIRGAIRAAIQRIGREELGKLSNLDPDLLEEKLGREGEYLPMTVISLACQINKSHNDPDSAHSSITECLKGTILRMPAQNSVPSVDDQRATRQRRPGTITSRSRSSMSDRQSARLAGFSFNTVVFLILGYFVGGFALAPLLGLSNCSIASVWPPSLTICSAVGVLIGSGLSLGYTAYFFAKKL